MLRFFLFIITISNSELLYSKTYSYVSSELNHHTFNVNSRMITINDSLSKFSDCSFDGVKYCLKFNESIIAIPDNLFSKDLEFRVNSLDNKKIYSYPISKEITLLGRAYDGYIIHIESEDSPLDNIVFFSLINGVLMFSSMGRTYISESKCGLYSSTTCRAEIKDRQ